jgi:hypothetical protein
VLVDVEIADLDHYVAYTSVYHSRSRSDIDPFLLSRPGIGADSVDQIHAEGAPPESRPVHWYRNRTRDPGRGPRACGGDRCWGSRTCAAMPLQRMVTGWLELPAL